MDMFHIFLPSNSPVEGNLTGNYTVRLPNTIDLTEGEWSVALSSIIYPVSYLSGEKEEMYIKYDFYDKNIQSKKYNISSDVIFTSIEHLEKVANNLFISKVRKTRQITDLEKQPLRSDLSVTKENEENEKNAGQNTFLDSDENKKLSSAKSEVTERSYKIVNDLAQKIEEKIVDIEALSARIDQISKLIILKAVPRDDFSTQEASDFKNYALDKTNKASQIRDESQKQRAWIQENQYLDAKISADIMEAVKKQIFWLQEK